MLVYFLLLFFLTRFPLVRFLSVPLSRTLKICTLPYNSSSSIKVMNSSGSGQSPIHTLFCNCRNPHPISCSRTTSRFRRSYSGISNTTSRTIPSETGCMGREDDSRFNSAAPFGVRRHRAIFFAPIRSTRPSCLSRHRVAPTVPFFNLFARSSPSKGRHKAVYGYFAGKKASSIPSPNSPSRESAP